MSPLTRKTVDHIFDAVVIVFVLGVTSAIAYYGFTLITSGR